MLPRATTRGPKGYEVLVISTTASPHPGILTVTVAIQHNVLSHTRYHTRRVGTPLVGGICHHSTYPGIRPPRATFLRRYRPATSCSSQHVFETSQGNSDVSPCRGGGSPILLFVLCCTSALAETTYLVPGLPFSFDSPFLLVSPIPTLHLISTSALTRKSICRASTPASTYIQFIHF
jgi:hypothetical protein